MPMRGKVGGDIRSAAIDLESIAACSCRSHPELVLGSAISEILIGIIDSPNAEAAAAKLVHWLTPIPSRGRSKSRIEARVFDHCARIIAQMPTGVGIRRRLWAIVARVRRVFALIGSARKSSTPRSMYAKMIVVSYFWTHDYWCDMSIAKIAHALGVRRQSIESARRRLNRHLPERMRFPDFSEA